MRSFYVVAHNNQGYGYIRAVPENSTTVYCDCELGTFKTLAEAEDFCNSVDPKLSAKYDAYMLGDE